jgi:hypothetical protein
MVILNVPGQTAPTGGGGSNPPSGANAGADDVDKLVRTIQMLLEDDAGQWATTEFILPRITIVNRDLESELEDLDLSYDEDIQVLLGVAAGTTDLSGYQADGQPLENLITPILLEWRLPGEDDTQWRPVPRVDKIIDTNTSATNTTGSEQGIISYQFRKRIIFITPSETDCDIRVTFQCLPNVLQSDSDDYIKGLDNVICWYTAALINGHRGNPDQAAFCEKNGDKARDNIEGILVKEDQNTPRRFGGRRSRLAGPIWVPPLL